MPRGKLSNVPLADKLPEVLPEALVAKQKRLHWLIGIVNPFNQLAKNKLITGGAILLIGLAGFSLYNQKTNNPEFYYNQGLTYAKNKNWDSAIADYNQALKLKPDYVSAYNNREAAYHQQGQYGSVKPFN